MNVIEKANPVAPVSDEPHFSVDDVRRMQFCCIKGAQRTELVMARKLVLLHGNDLRFCKKFGWLVWTGVRWEVDETGEVFRRAKDTIKKMYGLAGRYDDEEHKEWAKFTIRMQTRSKIEAMVGLAESEPEIVIRPEQLDCDPWLFNVENGTIDLRTGHLRDHDPKDYITKLSPLTYNSAAKCPRWLQFLEEVFGKDNPKMRDFVQRALGHSLCGEVQDHVLHVLFGVGANGKSTLTETVLSILGDYGLRAPRKLLIAKKNDGHSTDLAALRGVRFVSSAESGEGQELDEEFVKALTGGDRVTARYLYKNNFTFMPTWKVFLFTNCKPSIRGQDVGIWRRIMLWKFDRVFTDQTDSQEPKTGKKDRHLPEKLKAEECGILAWMVQGCAEWQKQGLCPPETVQSATKEYQEECDLIGDFIDECCEEKEGYEVAGGVLYGTYQLWAKENGYRALGNWKFSERVKAKGFTHDATGKTRRYSGLMVNSDWRAKYDYSTDRREGKG